MLWQRAGGPPNPAGLSWSPSCFRHVSGNSTSRKILRFVDKIAKSKYFQKATENEFIKKKMEEVSNTPLLLTVEVQELAGTLAVNIPPPPTDRVWYQPSFPHGHILLPAPLAPCKEPAPGIWAHLGHQQPKGALRPQAHSSESARRPSQIWGR